MTTARPRRPRALLVWEDTYCNKLHLLLKRCYAHLGETVVEIYKDSSNGNSKFDNYIQRSWPIAHRKGLLRSGPIDYVVCVADADRATSCCHAVEPPPSPQEPVDSLNQWITTANTLWTDALRENASLAQDRIFGRFLRWSKESVVAACFDKPDILAELGSVDDDVLKLYLKTCVPAAPAAISDDTFVHQFRKPQECLKSGARAVGIGPLSKSSSAIDIAIEKVSSLYLDTLLRRVPDLKLIAELLGELGKSATE